jgi:hypothetical protein
MSPEDVPDEVVALFYDASALCTDFTNDERPIRAGLAAVLPAHKTTVRAKVAEEILRNSRGTPVWQAAMEEAAEIARGDQP